MNINFKQMTLADKDEVLQMMKDFYSSDAVSTNGSLDIFETDFNYCISENPLLTGYIFESKSQICGYAMIAQSFSTEYGKPCFLFEDLYLKPDFRGFGIILKFLSFIESKHKDSIFKLEVEKENQHAVHVYKKRGFKELPYCEMIKL